MDTLSVRYNINEDSLHGKMQGIFILVAERGLEPLTFGL